MPSREFVKQAYELVPSNGNVLIHYVRNEKATCVEHWQALQQGTRRRMASEKEVVVFPRVLLGIMSLEVDLK